VLTALSALVLAAVLMATPEPPARTGSGAGTTPLTVAPEVRCADLVPPLPGTGRIVPGRDGALTGPPGVTVGTAADGTVGWRSDGAVRAVLVAGDDRAHLYRYEPTATADDGLRPPADTVRAVELCLDGTAQPDLVAVCIRAGHLPVAGPSAYADGTFDGALDGRIAVSVDPDDGTLDWRSDGPEVTAVVTATSAPVLVEYDPATRSGTDVPFLGRRGATGVVLFCGITAIRWDGVPDGLGPG
jgi:hypothetical protein